MPLSNWITSKKAMSYVALIGLILTVFTILREEYYDKFILLDKCCKILSTPVIFPLYAIILGLVFTVLLFRILIKIKYSQNNEPSWTSYKKDKFNDVIYRWTFEKDDKNIHGYRIENLTAYCHICELELINSECPKCRCSYEHEIKSINEACSIIWGHIDDKNWELRKFIK